jgi:hypothetical protein
MEKHESNCVFEYANLNESTNPTDFTTIPDSFFNTGFQFGGI